MPPRTRRETGRGFGRGGLVGREASSPRGNTARRVPAPSSARSLGDSEQVRKEPVPVLFLGPVATRVRRERRRKLVGIGQVLVQQVEDDTGQVLTVGPGRAQVRD